MNKWEINIKPSGVSIKTQQTQLLYNAEGEGVEVPLGGPHRVAIAVGDFETAELFTAHVAGLLDGKYGAMLAQVVSESVINATRADDAEQEALMHASRVDAMVNALNVANDRIAELTDASNRGVSDNAN